MKVHIVLQGKGGVGKSLVSSLIAQYKLNKSEEITCIDTDPVNASLSGYKALNVKQLKLIDDNEINSRSFDALIDIIAKTNHDIIIDNGASCFIPFSTYLIENDIVELINNLGHEVIIHTIVTGGQAAADTLNGFVTLIQEYPEKCSFVVWLNPYWGSIEINGKHFEDMQAYIVNKDRVSAIVRLPTLKKETFGVDFENMLNVKQTFDEAIADSSLTIMNRQRLKMTQREIFNSMTAASII